VQYLRSSFQIRRKLSLFKYTLQDEVQSEATKTLNNPQTPPSSTLKRPRTSEEYPPKQPIPQAGNGKTLQYSRTPTPGSSLSLSNIKVKILKPSASPPISPYSPSHPIPTHHTSSHKIPQRLQVPDLQSTPPTQPHLQEQNSHPLHPR
jgi:hypothetical protein